MVIGMKLLKPSEEPGLAGAPFQDFIREELKECYGKGAGLTVVHHISY